jgi:glycerol-3-phosphate acyltransferase PlsY
MIALLVIAGYFIGSIPFAWIVSRLVTGQDLRQMGSGNVGVLNTALSVSRWAGLLVFVAEATKGILAVILARGVGGGEIDIFLAVLATVAGTRWSIWLRGAGGRGNTAAMAALVLISWPTLFCALALWFLARWLTRSSFISMRITLVLWPIIFGMIMESWWALVFGAAFSLLFASTHRTETDDHLLLKTQWSSLGEFLTTARRK